MLPLDTNEKDLSTLNIRFSDKQTKKSNKANKESQPTS